MLSGSCPKGLESCLLNRVGNLCDFVKICIRDLRRGVKCYHLDLDEETNFSSVHPSRDQSGA